MKDTILKEPIEKIKSELEKELSKCSPEMVKRVDELQTAYLNDRDMFLGLGLTLKDYCELTENARVKTLCKAYLEVKRGKYQEC